MARKREEKAGGTLIATADFHIGNYPYGRINSKTGLNTRLEDIVSTCRQVAELAVAKKARVLVIAGDAFKDGSPTPTMVREFARAIAPALSAGIPVIYVLGNHPKGKFHGLAHALEPFEILKAEGLIVASEICDKLIDGIEFVCVPYFYPHERTLDEIKDAVAPLVPQRPEGSVVPRVLVGHYFTDMTVPKGIPVAENVLPTEWLAGLDVDAAFLGHQHRAWSHKQGGVRIIHPGSPDRVSFAEADEQKGCTVYDVDSRDAEFVELETRPFRDVAFTLKEGTPAEVDKMTADIAAGTILKVRMTIPESLMSTIDVVAMRRALKRMAYVAIDVDVEREDRRDEMVFDDLSVPAVFKQYVQEKVPEERRPALLQKGMAIIGEGGWAKETD